MWMCEHFRVSNDEGAGSDGRKNYLGWVASVPVSGRALLPLVKVRSGNNCVLCVCTVWGSRQKTWRAFHCCWFLPSLCDPLGNYSYSDIQRTLMD